MLRGGMSPSMIMLLLTLMVVVPSFAVASRAGPLRRKSNSSEAPAGVAKGTYFNTCTFNSDCNPGFSYCLGGNCVCELNCHPWGDDCVCGTTFQAWYVIVPVVIFIVLAVIGVLIRLWIIRRMLARRRAGAVVVPAPAYYPHQAGTTTVYPHQAGTTTIYTQAGPMLYPQAQNFPQPSSAYPQPPPPPPLPSYQSPVSKQ